MLALTEQGLAAAVPDPAVPAGSALGSLGSLATFSFLGTGAEE